MASIRTQRRDRQMHMALLLRSRGDIARLHRWADELNARIVKHLLAPWAEVERFLCESLQNMIDSIEQDFPIAEPDSAGVGVNP